MEAPRTDGFENKIFNHAGAWRPPFDEESAELAKRAVAARIDREAAPPDAEVVRLRRGISTPRVAATLLFLVGIPFFVWLAGSEGFENSTGETVSETLPGGTVVALAPGASVKYNAWIWPVNRSLRLSGAAFFDVKRGRPFKVFTAQGEVAVKGTSFSVWASESRTLVHCLSGKVAVRRGKITANLTEGMTVRSDSEREAFVPAYFIHDGPYLPSTATLNFDEVPICVVVSVLEQTFDARIVNHIAPGSPYSGDLTGKALDECLEILARTYGASLHSNDESIILMP